MKTYLVTGGAGFLGSHLCERLLNQGDFVVAVDNLSSCDGTNLAHLNNYNNFEFINHDVCYPLDYVCRGWKFNGIFNLACPASPPFYQSMPIETTLTCVLGAHNTLNLADKHGCKILQTSTSEVYGDPEVSPQPESYRGKVNCFGPRACYDEGKRAAEALFFDYQKQNGTDIRVVRIFNTYGPNMLADDGRVVSNFINQALNNESITVYGGGYQTRSFAYVSDTIDALMTVWNSEYKNPVNIGNPEEFTIYELAKKVIEITGSKSEITKHDLPTDDPMQRRPDISLALNLGWKGPTIKLDEGLRNTIKYFEGKKKSS